VVTRRNILETALLLPALSPLSPAWGADADPSRLALVMGNGNYRDSPLTNPVNDASAVGNLLNRAGFTVTSQFNSKRADMLGAIDKFSRDIRRVETKLVLFYYAGHGAQLDWRNYLVPVDAAVGNATEFRQSCIDLNLLLTHMAQSKDKTFVIILDACRNNPFGRNYQPEQKGLSQFDAPVGSLLAYATAPGNVASDGVGQNGLYTENLVRELSVRGTRIEDALKRVRLNVRLASKGAQIPWETTSLESDVFLFNNDQPKKLSEAEQEKLLEAELSEWDRIKSSKESDDWVGYLRNYPNGRFTEIAQTRLNRLLAQTASTAATSTANSNSSKATPPAISIEAGTGMPQLLQVSVNPYSAGRFPLGRIFSVGDKAEYQLSDLLTNVKGGTQARWVTHVDLEDDRVEFNGGRQLRVTDAMGNFLSDARGTSSAPAQIYPAELYVGKSWEAGWKYQNFDGLATFNSHTLKIVAFETVQVPAGVFKAFRVDQSGWSQNRQRGLTTFNISFWLVPGLNFEIKREVWGRGWGSRIIISDRLELISLRQQTMET